MMFMLHFAEAIVLLGLAVALLGWVKGRDLTNRRDQRDGRTAARVAALVSGSVLAILLWFNANIKEYVNGDNVLVYENKITGIRGYYYPHDRWHQWPLWEEPLNVSPH